MHSSQSCLWAWFWFLSSQKLLLFMVSSSVSSSHPVLANLALIRRLDIWHTSHLPLYSKCSFLGEHCEGSCWACSTFVILYYYSAKTNLTSACSCAVVFIWNNRQQAPDVMNNKQAGLVFFNVDWFCLCLVFAVLSFLHGVLAMPHCHCWLRLHWWELLLILV